MSEKKFSNLPNGQFHENMEILIINNLQNLTALKWQYLTSFGNKWQSNFTSSSKKQIMTRVIFDMFWQGLATKYML